MLYHYDDGHYDTLKCRQQWTDRHDTCSIFTIISERLTVVQREDGGPRIHGTAVAHGSKRHINISYKICVTKTGHIITRTAIHIRQILVPTESLFYVIK